MSRLLGGLRIRVRARAAVKRFVSMLGKGVIVVCPTARSSGPWLDATRATSLQRVGNRPIVCHALDALAAAGVVEVAVLTPPDLAAEVISCVDGERPSGVAVHPLVYDHSAEPLAALEAVSEFVGEAAAIVHRADGLLSQPLAPFLELLDGREAPDVVLLVAERSRNAERLGPATQRVLRVAELHPVKAALGIAGVCVLGPGILRRRQFGRRFAPALEPGALAEALLALGDRSVQVRVVREWRSFAGDTLDLLDMNRAVLDALECRVPAPETDGNRFEGRVLIDATASVTSSVICGPVIVGAGAQVADSYIGPHTSIGERVHVEGAEIERSIVLAGASILHVGGRLVASVVGREARIFRDFSVPRAMRLQVGDGDEVALC
jgi:glucose-1-phosphate thymidylyltransferase